MQFRLALATATLILAIVNLMLVVSITLKLALVILLVIAALPVVCFALLATGHAAFGPKPKHRPDEEGEA